MTDQQKRLFSLLVQFDQICRVSDIDYYLHGGTLLGAVRSSSFIPWDDDIDVMMKREDFNSLKLKLNDNDYLYITGGLKPQVRTVVDKNSWIDIFILDSISEIALFRGIKVHLLFLIEIMTRDKKSKSYSKLEEYGILKQSIYNIAFYFGKLFPNRFLEQLFNYIAEKCLNGNNHYCFRSNDQYIGKKMALPNDWFSKCIDMEFEGGLFKSSPKYNDILILSYGKDYMVPIVDQHSIEVHKSIKNND